MALQKLRDHFKSTPRPAFEKMLDQRIHVVEKLASSAFYVKRNDLQNEYFKASQQNPINIVDRTIVSFYEAAILHIQGLTGSVKEEMPKDWKFGFDYLIDSETPNVKYAMLPKNNLVLTHIQVLNPVTNNVQKVIRDTAILNKWSDKLQVQRPPVVFEGQLSNDQKEALINLLEMSDAAFAKKYEDRSFTRDIFSIFNSNLRNSSLQESLDAEIDGLIISFIDGKKMTPYKLENFNNVDENANTRKASDIYQITMVDLIEYLSTYNFKKHKLVEENKDRRFLELISDVFNNYIKENATKYIGVNFDVAEFAKSPEFKLNKTFIKNQETLKLVDNNILSELFKIVLSSFRNKRTKTTDILSEDMISQMNDIVKNINAQVAGKIEENDVLDFNSFKKTTDINDELESDVNEGLTVKYKDQGRKPVNMFVGRFQPFTLGHAKVIKQIYAENGYPIVIFLVKSKTKKKEDAFKRPYDEDTQLEMIKKLKRELPIEDVFVIDRGAIDLMFNTMRPKYEPVLWGTGSDRMTTYGFQVNKEEYRNDLGVRSDFGLFEIPRTGSNISATQVRNALLDNDQKLFNKLTPKSIHDMYDELKTKLEKSMELTELKDTVFTFEQFINKL
jgi:cytidyltransferase-like protein